MKQMKRLLPWLLLVLSVAFNVSFAAAYFRSRRALSTPGGRRRLMARMLDLDAEQKKQLAVLEAEKEAELQPLLEKIRPHRSRFWEEAGKPDPDVERAIGIATEDAAQVRRDMERVRVRFLLRLMKMLREDQKRKLARALVGEEA
jgi:hypothetical protein